MELRSWRKVKTKVILIVVDALGTVPKSLERNLKKAGTMISVKVASEDCSPWNSTHAQKGTRV